MIGRLTFVNPDDTQISISEATEKGSVTITMEERGNDYSFTCIDLEIDQLELLRSWIDTQIELLKK